jgi:hypothetical protein
MGGERGSRTGPDTPFSDRVIPTEVGIHHRTATQRRAPLRYLW